ncbi:MAG: PIN domain-containing protein [Candidatus Nanohaloarchaea archaeon]
MRKKIILDTNFLVAPFQLSLDLFDQLEELYPGAEIYTLDDAVQEAKSIESGKYRALVEKLLETQDIEVLKTEGEGSVDDLLVKLSDEYVIATNDRELRERLDEKDAETVLVRSKKKLEARNRHDLG